ncbi:MAG: hypothetical protein CFE21_08090 [Bacteroidetes bacterium B1(2017)]|nr:MAG: hypothetical protein CFE21_08090 [Bacteroidetes bacterium B1(2017)]
MDIAAQLMAEHSKRNTELIVNYIGSDPKLFAELVSVFSKGDYRLTQRASWPLSVVVEQHPKLAQKHIHFICTLLDAKMHVAIKRNVLRLLQYIDLPEEEMGPMADRCIKYIHDLHEPVAVKAFAMTVLYRICEKEPELKNEVIPLLEDLLPFGSAGIISRSKRVLAQLAKLP